MAETNHVAIRDVRIDGVLFKCGQRIAGVSPGRLAELTGRFIETEAAAKKRGGSAAKPKK